MFQARSSSMEGYQGQVPLMNKDWLDPLYQVAIYKNIMQFQSSSKRESCKLLISSWKMTSVKNIALLDRKDNTLGQLNRRNVAGLFVLGTLLANLPKNLPISWEVINSFHKQRNLIEAFISSIWSEN